MTTAIGWQAADGRAYGSPGRYIQRAGEIERLAEHLRDLGGRPFLLIDGIVDERHGEAIHASLAAAGLEAWIERFGGKCCREEIDRVSARVAEVGAAIVAGIGGGEIADPAKVAAVRNDARIAVVPTIASTDAPCSAIAVRYHAKGVMQEAISLPRNLDIVIVDSALIAKAPVRFLVAGMGDALSTFFEARSNLKSRSPNFVRPYLPAPLAGIAIARTCHEVLMRDGLPTTLADLDLADAGPDEIGCVAEAALKLAAIIGRVATPLSPANVRDAILALDAYTSGLSRAA